MGRSSSLDPHWPSLLKPEGCQPFVRRGPSRAVVSVKFSKNFYQFDQMSESLHLQRQLRVYAAVKCQLLANLCK